MDLILDELRGGLNTIREHLHWCMGHLNLNVENGDPTLRGNAKVVQIRLEEMSGELKKIMGEEPKDVKKLKFKPGDRVRIKVEISSGTFEYNERRGEVLPYRYGLDDYDHWIKVKGKPPVRVYEKELVVIEGKVKL